MGTSVAQIDATYGHLVPDSEEYLRGLLGHRRACFGQGNALKLVPPASQPLTSASLGKS